MSSPLNRPVPLVGDTSTARERRDNPASWAFDLDHLAAFDAVVAARRDVRRFRPDPLPDTVLREILEAGHSAPSVGHSQPWRFITIKNPSTRQRASHMADACRTKQARKLTEKARRKLLDLQLSGIHEAPVGVVVACDRRTKPSGVLGRDTFTDSDMWSCACAIQNMWLAARARGVGMGWVTLFEPDDLAELVGLPDGVETLGWLCFGWPDELNPSPGLERAGWSKKFRLDDVLMAEGWHEDAAPPTDYAPATTVDSERVVSVRDTSDELLTPPGSLGVLDSAIAKVEIITGKGAPRACAVVAVADHLVADEGVTAYPRSVNDDVEKACRRGDSLSAAVAAASDIGYHVVTCGTSAGNLVTTPPLTVDVRDALVDEGISWGKAHGRRGLVALGEVGMGNTTVASALAAWLLGIPPEEAVGLGAASNTAMVERKIEVVRSALGRVPADANPGDALLELGGPDVAFLAGVTHGVTQVGGIVVLDGMLTTVAASIAVREDPGVAARLVAGQASAEPAHRHLLDALGLEPLLDVRLRAGEGVGALLAIRLMTTAITARANTARTSPS